MTAADGPRRPLGVTIVGIHGLFLLVLGYVLLRGEASAYFRRGGG